MATPLPAPAQELIEALSDLDGDQWQKVREARITLLDRGYADAGKAMRLSASVNSAMQKAVLAALRQRADAVQARDPRGFSGAVNASEHAVGAVLAAARLDAEQFELLISPFVAAGMPRSVFDAEAS